MDEGCTLAIRESYDRLADEYARRFLNELQQKPLDRELLSRFAREVPTPGEVCDMGCGPGQIAAGFAIEEIIEREAYAPEVEYQSRRAYIFARKATPFVALHGTTKPK